MLVEQYRSGASPALPDKLRLSDRPTPLVCICDDPQPVRLHVWSGYECGQCERLYVPVVAT